ncbi:isoleucine--tRNA ligase [Micrococcales bacterium 31B]|nr:isoleucine--tRNA ligase [Micrococcales bacterium 31B]
MAYPLGGGTLTANPNFPDLERKILAFWSNDDTFAASVELRSAGDCGDNEYVFYDGPPFANGLPHYGHLLTGYVKDVIPRFQTMLGRRVERRFGWDTHGLPAELEAMKQLGMVEKAEIESMGIAQFNAEARNSVLRYTKEWEEYVNSQARWVDFGNDYKTLDLTYMESVIWAFKQLYDKGLAYEGYSVLPYCWVDETPLSNHELRMDEDVYQNRQDQTVTVTFPLTGERAAANGLTGVRALAWTTTPWTLPTNAALAVGPDITYVVVPVGPLGTSAVAAGSDAPGAPFLLAEDLLAGYAKDLGYESPEAAASAITARHRGADLADITYEPLFDYFVDEKYGNDKAWRVLVADYVSTTDGTGIVHQAPAYGEEDQKVCAAAGIPTVISVDDGAKFIGAVTDFAGQQVFEANKPITQKLRAEGRLVRQASYEHSYPHCWRCRNPLIYKAVGSWFVRVTEFRDRMVELNQEIQWVPGNVKDGQFGTWIANARDWAISRNRYWGSPIPVWKSDNPDYPRIDVYGSLDELRADFGVEVTDLHRPFIDEFTRPNPDDPTGASTMRRVTDVLDCWFESGSMPFAQVHYPFENKEWFDTHNPADFVVEYIGQSRGWFYTLHILATALFDRPAFKTSLAHGIVLGNDGNKMSKSLRNYPDVREVFDRDGADAMRWFLISSSILRGGNLVVTEQNIRDAVRQVLIPLWNVYYFFGLYANTAQGGEGYRAEFTPNPGAAAHVLDRYLLAKTGEVVTAVKTRLEAYDIAGACADVRDYLDVLSNWYVRGTRDRFWGGESDDSKAAFNTLYTALETLCRVAAPLLPMVGEEIWKGLTGGRSVHLTDYPDATQFAPEAELIAAMDRVRETVSAALSLRKAHKLRARLPLAELTVVGRGVAALADHVQILRDELNVKSVKLVDLDEDGVDQAALGVTQRLTVNARAAGPRLGKNVQAVIKASKSGNWSVDGDVVTCGEFTLEAHEYTLELVAAEADSSDAIAVLGDGGFVVLDTAVTPELAAEGAARDVIRAVQQARRDADFDVADRISLALTADADTAAALETHRELVAEATLATQYAVTAASDQPDGATPVGEAGFVAISVEKNR